MTSVSLVLFGGFLLHFTLRSRKKYSRRKKKRSLIAMVGRIMEVIIIIVGITSLFFGIIKLF